MVESVIVNEWKAEASLKSKVEDILDVLKARFGPIPADATAKIESMDKLDVIKRWVLLSAQAPSLDDFRRDAGV